MANFGDAIRKGLFFSIDPRRWLPLLAVDMLFLGTIFYFILRSPGLMILSSAMPGTASPQIAGAVLGFLFLGAAWLIIRTWIMGALVQQARHGDRIKESYYIAVGRLHKIIISIIIVSIMSMALSLIPWFGWLISIILAWMFLFLIQGIMLDNLGVVSTFKNSFKMFQKSPMDIFLTWALISIVSFAIMSIFIIVPLLILSIGFALQLLSLASLAGPASPGTINYITQNLPIISALGVVFLMGMELTQVFSIGAQTDVYIQLKKKFPSILKSFQRLAGRLR